MKYYQQLQAGFIRHTFSPEHGLSRLITSNVSKVQDKSFITESVPSIDFRVSMTHESTIVAYVWADSDEFRYPISSYDIYDVDRVQLSSGREVVIMSDSATDASASSKITVDYTDRWNSIKERLELRESEEAVRANIIRQWTEYYTAWYKWWKTNTNR